MRDTFWKVIVTVALIVVLTFGAGLFIVQGAKNTAISYEEQVAVAQSDIQVQEKRRSDLIPNLVETVKTYDKHEYDTLMAVIAARGSSSDAAVSEITTQIAAVAEAYPELQSADNYRELMNELAVTENLIANYRSDYNRTVKSYRQYVRRFPNSTFLSLTGYEVQSYALLSFNVSEDAPSVGNLFGDQRNRDHVPGDSGKCCYRAGDADSGHGHFWQHQAGSNGAQTGIYHRD